MSKLKIFTTMELFNEAEAKYAAEFEPIVSIKMTVELIVRVYNYQAPTNKKTLKLNIIKKG
jgi:hypothetical protein